MKAFIQRNLANVCICVIFILILLISIVVSELLVWFVDDMDTALQWLPLSMPVSILVVSLASYGVFRLSIIVEQNLNEER